ncbi:MAG: hypothetical protein ACIAXF_08600 [Phycisphaerales bacterium JB063]
MLVGCQSQPITDPVATANDRGASTTRRVRAVRETPATQADGLMPLVLSVRHPFEVRRAAVERMAQADADAFWHAVGTSIRRINDWPMLELLCERSAEAGRVDFVPALVQSWARPSIRYADIDRPERIAIQTLAPALTPEEQLWPMFHSAAGDRASQRIAEASWIIMCRTHDHADLRRQLRETPSRHELHTQLQRISASIEQLPGNNEELLRMRTLCRTSSDDDWGRREHLLSSIPTGSQAAPAVALRHLPVIDHADDTAVRMPRGDRWSSLTRRLTSARHVERAAPAGRSGPGEGAQTLARHADTLGWADLLVIEAMLDAIAQPSVVSALFEQAEQDRLDTTTELGGVLVWDDDGRLVAQPFEPAMRRRDAEFIASDACVRAMHTGLAHYHFHAQRYDNADWAGPGGGDEAFADNMQANCIVFTFVDRNTLNADAYFPGGIVVDLGCIHR